MKGRLHYMVDLDDLTEIMNLAYAAKSDLYETADEHNKPVQVILHWTAGKYYSYFDDYHINIDGDGDVHITQRDFAHTLPHNYYKNAASIGLTLCCAYNATTNDLGDYPPTEAQIEAMAKVMAVLSEALDIDIDIVHFPSHGSSADNLDFTVYFPDPTNFENNTYGPRSNCERWDLQKLRDSDEWTTDPDDPMSGPNQLRSLARAFRQKFYGH